MKRLMKIYLEKPELAAVVFLLLLLVVFQIRSDGVFLGRAEPARNARAAAGNGARRDRRDAADDLRRVRSFRRLGVRADPDDHGGLARGGGALRCRLRGRACRRGADRLHQWFHHHSLRHTELHHHARHAVRGALADRGHLRRLSTAAPAQCAAEMAVHRLCRAGRAVPHVVLLVRDDRHPRDRAACRAPISAIGCAPPAASCPRRSRWAFRRRG